MFENLTSRAYTMIYNCCKESSVESITGFKIIFDLQNLGIFRHLISADIYNIGRDMVQNRIFGNGGAFRPSVAYTFWTILTKVTYYNSHKVFM